jgi:hypothetical protein
MITANPSKSAISNLYDLAQVLNSRFPRVWDKVGSAYESNNIGQTLARIDNTNQATRRESLAEFPTLEKAESRTIDFGGMDRYIYQVLSNNGSDNTLKNILRNDYQTRNKLPRYQDIGVLSSLVQGHPLIKFIAKQKPLLAEDLLSVFRSGFPDLEILRKDDSRVSTGVLKASQGPSHGDHVWTRDMAAVALGKRDIGQNDFAVRIATKLYQAYSHPSQRTRMNYNLGSQETWDKPRSDKESIPHTRFDVEAVKDATGKVIDYNLKESESNWGMRQLDAYGYFLQLAAKLADDDKLNIAQLDAAAKNQFSDFYNGRHNAESTLVALSRMLIKIEYWNRSDFGAWENALHTQRASSLAACVSGLQSVYNYFENKGYFENPESCPIEVNNEFGEGIEKFKSELEQGIAKGKKVLFSKRIPSAEEASTKNAIEVDPGGEAYDKQTFNLNREKDAALLFTLVLSDPQLLGMTRDQEDSILRTVYELIGDVGFKRFPEDEYMGMNWTTNKHPVTKYGEHTDNTQANYKAAEWSFFDPYLATLFYKRFIESEGKDLESFLRADRHSRRALAQITKANHVITRQTHKQDNLKSKFREIKIPAGEVMEHFWYNTKDLKTGKNLPSEEYSWMPGENYGLNWTKIALQQMIYNGSKAAEIFKEEYPNGWSQHNVVGLNLTSIGKDSKVKPELALAG